MNSVQSIPRQPRLFRVKVAVPGVAPYAYTARASSSVDCIEYAMTRLIENGAPPNVRISAFKVQ